jgi:hypothetical protein
MTATTLSPATEIRRLRAELAVLHRLVAALLDAIDPDTEAAYRRQLATEAYQRGQDDAYSAGYVAAVEDVKCTEHELVDVMRLVGLRARPCGVAWLAAVDRHGGTEWGGAGQPRVQVPADAIERAKEAQR